MQRKIHAVRTMQKSQSNFQTAPTAARRDCPIGFAPLADNTRANRLQRPLKIGVDLMGNDNAPQALLSALQKLSIPSDATIVAIGSPSLAQMAAPLEYVSAAEVIEMDDHPLLSLRRKKQASIPIGVRLLKEGKLDAFVSAGNTGALISSAKMILRMLPGCLRPSLMALMPTKKQPVAVLDLGANVQIKAEHLVQFAKMGVAFQKIRGLSHPRIGLLNIGTEPLKGTSELKSAYHALEKTDLHFVGNIEGKTVFDGDVDVLITDGFTGNIFLKTAEGVASLILDKIHADGEMKRFQSLTFAEYPGALLVGVNGIVIKCHGYATPKGITNGVLEAIHWAKEGFVQKIKNEL